MVNLSEIEKKHLFLRLFYIVGVLLVGVILFFTLWDDSKSAMGAAMISLLWCGVGFIWLITYFAIESVLLYKKKQKRLSFINLGFVFTILVIFLTIYILN